MKSKKIKLYFSSFSYTIIANFISLLISAIVVFLLPRVMKVENYGFYQLYLFYIGYVGIFQFGWNDGLYLRYGGTNYEDLDKPKLRNQFIMLLIFQVLIGAILALIGIFIANEEIKYSIIISIIICMILTNLNGFCLYILQVTFRIKEYAIVSVIGRCFFLLFVILIILSKTDNYMLVIISELLGNFVSLITGSIFIRQIIFYKEEKFKFDFIETRNNIGIGIKLMFANLSNILIIGIIRFGIQLKWDIETFAKISLTLSVSNLLLTFMTAIGSVLFPILRKTNPKKLKYYFMNIRDIVSLVGYFALIIYFPVRYFLSNWLIQYSESLKYMALLFPMCIYLGKSVIIGNSFLNNLRKEGILLKINIITVILSIISTIVCVFLLKNLTLTIISIVVILAFRMLLAEIYLCKYFKVNTIISNFLESILTIVFMYVGWNLKYIFALVIYLICYVVYLAIIGSLALIRYKKNKKNYKVEEDNVII